MAGWDLPFNVSYDDEQLARDCFRVLRRTCARFYLDFCYRVHRRGPRAITFLLAFEGRPPNLGLASADFTLEMRALSTVQRHPRKRKLPLRLAQWVTYSGSDEPLRLQPVSDRVPQLKRDAVIQLVSEYALAWGAWRRGELSPPEYLEAQHSLLNNWPFAVEGDRRVVRA